jgi:methanogenic corrinoid protein MtbC1
VKTKIKDGMQTASAINLFRHQEQTNQLKLPNQNIRDARELKTEESHSFNIIKPSLLDAMVNKNLSEADEILGNLIAIYTPEDLLIELITPTLSEIGEKWHRGEISVSIEHLATNYLRHRALMWMLSSPPAKAVSPIMLACAPQEWHEGSLLILGTLLRRRRWPITYLGQSVPLSDLAKFIDEIKPSVVVLVAMMEESAHALEELSQFIPISSEINKPIIGFGGRIFVSKPELCKKIPGRYLGNTFMEGINNIERLIKSFIG